MRNPAEKDLVRGRGSQYITEFYKILFEKYLVLESHHIHKYMMLHTLQYPPKDKYDGLCKVVRHIT